MWRAIVAAGGAFLGNNLVGLGVMAVTGSEAATTFTTTNLFAPVVEEILKGLAVFPVFIKFTQEFDSILDGIIYAGVTALGFAATENALYIYRDGFLSGGWQGFRSIAFVRIVLVGWQHPFYTAFTGIGLAIARLNRSKLVKIIALIIGLSLAILGHGIHNYLVTISQNAAGILITTAINWLGWLFMFVFIVVVLSVEQSNLKRYLEPEVDEDVITQSQFSTATSAFKIIGARLSSIFKGHYGQTTRLYRKAAERAITKKHLDKHGEEDGNQETFEQLREEVRTLSQRLQN